jgi:hypothetical protein
MPVTVGASMQAPDLASTAILHGVAVPDGFDFNAATHTQSPRTVEWVRSASREPGMNVSTGAVRFDDGAVRIESSDGAAAVPEQGSLGLPAEGLRPAAPLGRNPRNRRCGFFLSENLNMSYRFGGARRALRAGGEDKKFGKWLFRFASIANP